MPLTALPLPSSISLRRGMSGAALALALVLAACGPARDGAAGAAPLVYVANAGDGTISRLDPAQGRVVGHAIPVGPGPAQVAAGSGGQLLVLSPGQDHARQLTSVAAVEGSGAARAIPLEPGAQAIPLEPGAQATLVAAGGRYAAVVYTLRDSGGAGLPRCRLALVDLPAAAALRTHSICQPNESAMSLAMADDPAGPVAYLALWTGPRQIAGRWYAGSGRVAAFDLRTGALVGSFPLGGVPGPLLVAPAPGRLGHRLYCVESFPGEAAADEMTEFVPRSTGGSRWQLTGLNPATLYLEDRHPFDGAAAAPRSLAVAPDGERAYALAPREGTLRGSAIVEIDLLKGTTRRLAVLPAEGLGIHISGEHIYVAHPEGNAVWMVDRRQGRLLKTIPAGRRPVAIADGGRE